MIYIGLDVTYQMNTVMILSLSLFLRNGTPQYRSSPHSLSYNPAENAILVCSVSDTSVYYNILIIS